MNTVADLDERLKAAGIPILGVSYNRTPLKVVVQFGQGATAKQMADAQAIVDAFDWTPRRTRALGNIVSDVEAWIGTDAGRLRKIAALAAVLGAAGAGQLDRLQALTSIDPTEPDV